MSHSTRPAVESLLAHVEWVRRLARALVADEHAAADVEQETWRHALERPPLHVANLRGWLGTVARNVARKLGRDERTRREHEARLGVEASRGERASGFPRGTASTTPADVTARAELHRKVVEAVLALEELYRTPLLLRFFDGLDASDVARELGVPLETARTRIKRGVALVRERLAIQLAPRGGGEWAVVLAPLLVPRGGLATAASPSITSSSTSSSAPSSSTSKAIPGSPSSTTAGVSSGAALAGTLIGGALVSKPLKIAIAVAVVAAAAWWPVSRLVEGRRRAHVDPAVATANPAQARSHDEDARPADVAPEPASLATRPSREREEPLAREPAESAAELAEIAGRVVDASGVSVAGATVVLGRTSSQSMSNAMSFRHRLRSYASAPPTGSELRTATTDPDGAFFFDEVDPRHRWAVGAFHDPLGTCWSDEVAFEEDPTCAEILLVLEPGVVVFGVVRDPQGRPIQAAHVFLVGTTKPPSHRRPGFTFDELQDGPITDEQGRYRSMPLPWRHWKAHVIVHEGRPDLARHASAWEELPPGQSELRRDFELPALAILRGRILGPDGQPARLRETVAPALGADATRHQSTETIAVVALASDPRADPKVLETLGRNTPGVVLLDGDRAWGTLSLDDDSYEVPLRNDALRYVAVIARQKLLGAAEIPSSRAAPDVVVDPKLVPEQELLHALSLHVRAAEDGAPLDDVQAFAMLWKFTASGQRIRSMHHFDPRGPMPADRVLDVPRQPLSLHLARDGFVTRTLFLDASRPDAPRELTVELEREGAALSVLVQDADARPIPGAFLRIYRAEDLEPVLHLQGGSAEPDEHGRCTVDGVPAGHCIVVAQKDGFAPAAAEVSTHDEPAAVELTLERGYDVVLNAALADGTPASLGTFVVLDESGRPIHDTTHPHGAGLSRLAGTRLRLHDGTWTVRCRTHDGLEGSTTFVAAPGAEVEVRVERRGE